MKSSLATYEKDTGIMPGVAPRIVGASPAIREVFRLTAIASKSRVTVLVQGESGTGKELVARAIHSMSAHRGEPFVALNCSALVDALLESELFGHEKGAFTNAFFKKEGKFEVAGCGTIFLDEVGEMSPALQVKLLRVLQERSFERVGGSKAIHTPARVIAATNRDLSEMTKEGRFREDLFYRLKVMTIEVPPLRDRNEDIALLIRHFIERSNHELGRSVKRVPEEVMARLLSHDWPGNVRELENVITRGVLLAGGDELEDVELIPNSRLANEPRAFLPERLDAIERRHILSTLEHVRWNKSQCAILLGITLPRLSRKMAKYGITRTQG